MAGRTQLRDGCGVGKNGTKAAWFGPKRLGWGWEPVSWQGWAMTAVFVVAALLSVPLENRFGEPVAVGYTLGLTVVLMGVCVVKGTRPGGPKARKEYERQATRAALPAHEQGPPLTAKDVRERLGNRRPDLPPRF